MADVKITALTAISSNPVNPATFPIPMVDLLDNTITASGTTKKVTVNQILGSGGTATLASATITGDLTVDTSTLKVDSTNDRVGIGTASPAQFVHLSKSNTSTALTSPPVGGASLRIQNSSSTNNNFGSVEFYNAAGLFGASVNCQYTNQATPTSDLVFVTRGSLGGLEHYRIAADGVSTWSEIGGVAGTAMTLNATGLGIGVASASIASNLHVKGASGTVSIRVEAVTDGLLGLIGAASGLITGSPANNLALRAENGLYLSGGGNSPQFILNSSGNVGIGVTPIAWQSGFKELQVGAGSAVGTNGSVDRTDVAANWYYNSGDKYINATGKGSVFSQSAGAFSWLQTNTASGGVGSAMTLTTAMTLDASGRLIRGGSTADTLATDAATMVNIGNFAVQNAAAAGTYIAIKPDVANQNVNINIDARTGVIPDLRFLFGSSEKFRLSAAGNFNVANGNVVMTTSGKGIDFSAVTGGTGTATANVLNDYEEGTFTPTVLGGTTAGVGVYTQNAGYYTKVGNLVTASVFLGWSAHTGTGVMFFGALPFTSGSGFNSYSAASVSYINNIALTASNVLNLLIGPNLTYLEAYQYPVGGGAATTVPIDLAGQIVFTITYRV